MFEAIRPFFKETEVIFGEPAKSVKPEEAKAILYGVPLDVSTTFMPGTAKGPAAMRRVSADLLEVFMAEFGQDYFAKVPIYDLGDFVLSSGKKEQLEQIKKLELVNSEIRKENKIPVVLGGEHTISFPTICGVAREKPVILHFDAHRDFKPEPPKESHTSQMQFVLGKIPPSDLIQIGIRQMDAGEERFAKEKKIMTVRPKDISSDINAVKAVLADKVKGRKVYISFDIDCLDSAYTPATGAPVSFGPTPRQILESLEAIGKESKELIGLEMVEVGQDANFREAELAVQLLLHALMYAAK